MEKKHLHEYKAAVLALICRGLITPSQAARLAGVSRQLVDCWLKAGLIDWRSRHQAHVAKLWRNEIARRKGRKFKSPNKQMMRKRAQSAKVEWDAFKQKTMATPGGGKTD